MKRTSICAWAVLAAVGVPVAQGGLFEDIYRGLELVVTPSGAPIATTGDGFRVNGQRSGRLRILPDGAGRGYTLEFDRNFGPDSTGRPEVLDLGMYELELSGATTATLGYTSRGMLIGSGDISVENLNYSLRGKSGAQDFEFLGNLWVDSAIEINQLGFYRLNVDISNRDSLLKLDGVLVEDDDTSTNFDIGPISIDGNIYVDALMAVMGIFGIDTTPLEQIFPGSPIDRILDPVQQEFERAAQAAGIQLDGDGQVAPVPAPSEPDVAMVVPAMVDGEAAGDEADRIAVPEPGTLMLIGLSGIVLWGCRRR